MQFQGAEAIVEVNSTVIKKRLPKSYRINQLDEKLIKERTKREISILNKCPVPCPELINSEKNIIEMTRVPGTKLSETLEKHSEVVKTIAKQIAELHNKGIIHGDLTTSNIIYDGKTVYFIDFGLSFFSRKKEDKAVDLHLFRQALESKHHTIYEKSYEQFLKSYKRYSDKGTEILERLEEVEKRGRYKRKGS